MYQARKINEEKEKPDDPPPTPYISKLQKAVVLPNPAFLDAMLYDVEADVAKKNVVTDMLENLNPDFLFVSPMRRTLQTAAIVWKGYEGLREAIPLDLITEKRTGDRPCDNRQFPLEDIALHGHIKQLMVNIPKGALPISPMYATSAAADE